MSGISAAALAFGKVLGARQQGQMAGQQRAREEEQAQAEEARAQQTAMLDQLIKSQTAAKLQRDQDPYGGQTRDQWLADAREKAQAMRAPTAPDVPRIDPLSPDGIGAAAERARQIAEATAPFQQPAAPRSPVVGSPEWQAAKQWEWTNQPVPKRDQVATEGQTGSAQYAARMITAGTKLNGLEETGRPTGTTESIGRVPLLGGLALSDSQQKYRQLQEDWVRAKLRRESGAAIGDAEMAKEIETYFPLPTDSPATRLQKQQRRALAEQLMKRAAGPAWDATMDDLVKLDAEGKVTNQPGPWAPPPRTPASVSKPGVPPVAPNPWRR